MDCSASEMPLDSQMVPVTEVEYVIPIFIFVIKLSVNVDAKLDATLDYQICEVKKIRDLEADRFHLTNTCVCFIV